LEEEPGICRGYAAKHLRGEMIDNRPVQTRTSRGSMIAKTAAAFGAAVFPRQAVAQARPEQVRVVTRQNEAITPLYYAIKSGLFQRAGLDVQMTASNSGSASTAALLAGDFEFAQTNVLALLAAHLKGVPLVLVAPSILYTLQNREALLQMAPDASLKSGKDLNGRTIGIVSLSDIDALAAKAWIDKNGGDSHSLKYLEIPMSAMAVALGQHRIDAAVIEPPQLEISIADGTSKTLGDPMSAIASRFMIGGYITRPDWAAQHAETVRTFTRVLSTAATYVNAHQPETVELVSELTKLQPADVAKMQRTISGTRLDGALIQPCIDAAAKYGMIEHGFPARELLWNDVPG
jgi:NitT/TauT family transport system substrate-binding protein